MVIGQIVFNFYGFCIISICWLISGNFGVVGILVLVVLFDFNQVFYVFDVIINKWYEGMYEDFLVGEFVWDIYVINLMGVVVVIIKV